MTTRIWQRYRGQIWLSYLAGVVALVAQGPDPLAEIVAYVSGVAGTVLAGVSATDTVRAHGDKR